MNDIQFKFGTEDPRPGISSELDKLFRRFPRIKNLYFGWKDDDGEITTTKPPGNTSETFYTMAKTVADDLDGGHYILISRNERTNKIYEWLAKKHGATILETGRIHSNNIINPVYPYFVAKFKLS